jgi:hypothetical protein
MGRGGYDTTDASAAKSLVAQAAINQHHAEQATAEVYSHLFPKDTLSGLTLVSDGRRSSRPRLLTGN